MGGLTLLSVKVVRGESSSVGKSTGLWIQGSRVRIPSFTLFGGRSSATFACLGASEDSEKDRNEQEDKSEHQPGGAIFFAGGIDALAGVWPDDYAVAVLEEPDILPK